MHVDRALPAHAPAEDALTVPAPPSDPAGASRRWLRFAGGALLVLLAAGLPLLRQTGARSWRTVWGEDGKIYFQHAHDQGVFGALFRGYAGYLQLPPRVFGSISTVVPLRAVPLFFAVAATVTCALLAWFVYWASQGWVSSRLVRLCLASLVVLMPQMGWEGTANVTNTPWAFLAATPWALLSLNDRRRDVILRAVVTFFAATATPMTVILLPLGVAQAVRHRARFSVLVPAAFFAGLVLQAVVLTQTASPLHDSLRRAPARIIDLLSVRVFAEYLVGEKGVAHLWADHGQLLMYCAPLVVGGLFVLLLRSAAPRRRLLALGFAGAGVMVFTISAWSRGTNHITLSVAEVAASKAGTTLGAVRSFGGPGGTYISNGLRYSVVPVFFLASAFAVLVSDRLSLTSRIGRVAPLLFVAHVVILTAIGFSVTNRRSPGPDWPAQISQVYENRCARSPSNRKVQVRNAPYDPTYLAVLTCRELQP